MFYRQLDKSSRTIERYFWRVPEDDVYLGKFNQMRRLVIYLFNINYPPMKIIYDFCL